MRFLWCALVYLIVGLASAMAQELRTPDEWVNEGYRLLGIGRPREASEAFRQAEVDGRLSLAETLLSHVRALAALGRYRQADILVDLAKSLLRTQVENGEFTLLDTGLYIHSLNAEAILRWEAGRYQDALRALQEALELSQSQAIDPHFIWSLRNNLALVFVDLGRGEEAEGLFGELSVSPPTPEEGILLSNNWADSRRRNKDLKGALAIIESALNGVPQDEPSLVVADTRETYGKILYEMGKTAQAKEQFQLTSEMAAKSGDLDTEWRARAGIGRCLRETGNLEGAYAELRVSAEKISQLRSRGTPRDREQMLDDQQSVFDDLMDLALKLGRESDAIEIAEWAKGHELASRFHIAGSRLPNQDRYASLAETAAQAQFLESELQRVLSEAPEDEQQISALQAKVRESRRSFAALAEEVVEPGQRALYELHPPSLGKLQSVLPANSALLEPVSLDDRLVLFLVTPTAMSAKIVSVSRDELDDLVLAYRGSVHGPPSQSSGRRGYSLYDGPTALDPTVPATELYRHLIEPITGDLERSITRHLFISPSGSLRYLPFGALSDGEQHLVERLSISYLTRGGQVALAGEGPGSPDFRGLVALGNPDGSLPASEIEIGAINQLLPGRAAVQEEATAEFLQRYAEQANFLHLATHGVLDNQRPTESYLVLAGKDARLTYGDIPSLRLNRTRLVTLSACNSAVGKGGGAEIYGLAYQFERAQANAVLGTLWAVDDTSTASFMEGFYRELRSGIPRAEALRKTQLAFRESKEWRHPYYWAPFVLIGPDN